jgi:hypothetical protein
MALTVSEQEQLNNLKAEAARLQAELDATEPEPTQERGLASRAAGTASDIVVPAGAATVGQAIGALPVFSVPTLGLSVPIGGAIGGTTGYLANELAQGRSPTLGGATNVAITSALPGGQVARMGSVALRSEAAKQAMASMAGAQAERAIDEGKPISPLEAGMAVAGAAVGVKAGAKAGKGAVAAEIQLAKQQADVDQRRKLAMSLGYKLDPVQSNPTTFTKGVERLQGGQAVAQAELARINQPVTNRIIRSEIGLAPDDQLNSIALDNLRYYTQLPYRQLEQVTPLAKTMLEKINTARADARDLWKDYSVNARTETKKQAIAATQRAETLENGLEKLAKRLGNPTLVAEMKAARAKLAKIFVAESALNDATQNIDAIVIGQIHESNPKYLTDSLRDVAEIANMQRAVMKEFVRPPSAGTYAVRSALTAGLGAAGYQMGGPQGLAAGALAGSVADIPFRALAGSRPYQAAYGIPRYEALTTPTAVQTFLMQSGRQAGAYSPNNPPR